MSTESRLIELVAKYSKDPLGYSRMAYPWGKGALAGSPGPRAWQAEILDAIGTHLSNPSTRFEPLKIAVASGRGIGKSGLIGLICQWAMSTCVDTKIVVTANTDRQLRTKTWPEITKWFKQAVNTHWFRSTATTIVSTQVDHEDSWRADAYPWSLSSTESFQGLHNMNRRIVLIFDEASGVDDQIWNVSEGSLTDENTEMIWIAFSNPTRNSGRFRECFGRYKHRWLTRQIDSRTVEGTNKGFFQQMVDDNGEDSDYVRVHVKGEFPRVGTMQFISSEMVEQARKREAFATLSDPLIMGVDVARYGDDCFDDITEILTDEGWKLFSDLHGDEKVLSLDKEKASWEKIDKVHKYQFDGELNLLESRHLNFCVTDKHRMLVRSNTKSNKYVFREYSKLPKEFIIREKNGWSGKSPESITFTSPTKMPYGGIRNKTLSFDYNDWSTFLGWFVSEGNVYKEKRENGRLRILITQNPGKKQERIKDLLTKMGITWRVTSNNKQIEFSNKVIGNYLIKYCCVGASNKRVPKEIRDGSEKTIRLFLDAFLLGDGTCKSNGKGRSYITSSKYLADDIQEMLAKLGCAGLCRLKEHKGSIFNINGRDVTRHNDTYIVYERSFTFGKTVNKRKVKRVPYKGHIWCVSTKYQSIYVRRKGVPMWSGNSSVIVIRRGRDARSIPWEILRGVDTMTLAARVMELQAQWQCDAIFVDGGGVGGGVIDRLRMLKQNVIEVQFGGKADRGTMTGEGQVQYANKRSEIWGYMRDWLKGGSIPDENWLADELVNIQYGYVFRDGKDAIQLEKKSDMKARGLASTDGSDALAITFAYPVLPSDHSHALTGGNNAHQYEYNPFSRDRVMGK